MKKLCLAFLTAVLCGIHAHAVDPSGKLPVMVIETKSHQPIDSKENYVSATYYIDSKGIAGVESIGSAQEPLPLKIKGRGNYTWAGFNKKPYRLKLDKKAALLGMESSKHFALLAHADDNRAFMRNLTGFEVSRMAGLPWTPADQPCEVILNGDYIGLYFLTETIRFDKKRINLDNPDDMVEDWLAENPDKSAADYPFTEEDYTGPWLVELDNNKDEFQVEVPSRHREGAVILITHKSPEDYVTEAHRNWLRNEFDEIDRLIYADDNANDGWLEKIDLTDAAKFFVVNQIMCNYESYSGSCYLTKDKGASEKWHFGPVWDFGSSFQESRDQTKWIWDSQYIQHWVGNMWNCQAFRDEVKRIFVEMDKEGFKRIYDYQNAYAARIAEAAKSDAERWKNDGYGNPDMQTPLESVQKQLAESIQSFGYKLGVEGYTLPVTEPSTDIYLRGSMTNWDAPEHTKFTKIADGMYELKLDVLSDEFKLAGPEWGVGNVDYGYTGEAFELDKVYTLVNTGANMKMKDGEVKDVKLLFDWSKKMLTVSHTSAIDTLPADGVVNEKPEYFNLQGIPVVHPEKGVLYIIRQGSKVTKSLAR